MLETGAAGDSCQPKEEKPMRTTGKIMALTGLLAAVTALPPAFARNAGADRPNPVRPFAVEEIATFDTPWAIAVLADGRMLVTEKPGRIFLVDDEGSKTEVEGVPAVAARGQDGLLDIAPAPSFAEDGTIYFTYVEPGGGTALALARATLAITQHRVALENIRVIFRQEPRGGRGQPGGIIAFDPDGTHLFLTTGDRRVPKAAQDPDDTRGKVLRLALDGSAATDNPAAASGGVRAKTWTRGHRNPYGLAFSSDGRLWLHEMGPRGGDEFNRIEPGRNYGWPLVSNGDNYNGVPIPRHATRPDLDPPVLYWNPVIAPSGLAFYDGDLFAAWRGSALVGGLASTALIRIALDGKGGADEIERWDMEARIRDVAVAPDGSVWLIEDDSPGRLLRLVPEPAR
jgi:glucose/arabinose dehydrogenase